MKGACVLIVHHYHWIGGTLGDKAKVVNKCKTRLCSLRSSEEMNNIVLEQ